MNEDEFVTVLFVTEGEGVDGTVLGLF